VAENPLATLARIAGGLVLLDGNLGHQVLGQLLIMNTNEVAMAAAAAVMAGTTGQRNAFGQVLLRTAVPAAAVRIMLNKQEERIDRKAVLLEERERALARRAHVVRRKHRRLAHDLARLGNTMRARTPRRASRHAFRDGGV
jgi:hypothetical protein